MKESSACHTVILVSRRLVLSCELRQSHNTAEAKRTALLGYQYFHPFWNFICTKSLRVFSREQGGRVFRTALALEFTRTQQHGDWSPHWARGCFHAPSATSNRHWVRFNFGWAVAIFRTATDGAGSGLTVVLLQEGLLPSARSSERL